MALTVLELVVALVELRLSLNKAGFASVVY